MGAGKGGRSTTTQTIINDVPPYAKPYFERNLQRAEGIVNQPYAPYGGQRLAQFNPDILAGHQLVRDIAQAGIPGMQQAMNITSALPGQAQQLANNPRAEFNEYTGFNAFQFDPARQFTGEEVQRYMSPYMDAVVQRQQDNALLQFQRLQALRNANAVGAGAFGGSRQAVQEALAEESLMRQMGDIYASGRQQAFENAAQMFQSDRAAQMLRDSQQANELARIQDAIAQERARVERARADEAMRRDEFGLASLGFQGDIARQLAELGEQARAGNIQAAQLLDRIGMQRMAQEQAGLDIAYQDFLRQEAYPRQQVAFMSDLLRGLPIANSGVTQVQRPYNPLQELLGLGISGIALYNALRMS
jgi:hypothetical protein